MAAHPAWERELLKQLVELVDVRGNVAIELGISALQVDV
jgi:hypothetical protein